MTSNLAERIETEEFYNPPYLSQFDWLLSGFQKSLEGLVDRDTISPQYESVREITHQEQLNFPDRGFNMVISYVEPFPAWFKPTLNATIRTLYLDDNWDTYGARPVDPTIFNEVFDKLKDLLSNDSPAPSVVPTRSEGLQFEWHQSQIDIEIEISPRDGWCVYFENHITGESSEGDLDTHFQTIKSLLSKI